MVHLVNCIMSVNLFNKNNASYTRLILKISAMQEQCRQASELLRSGASDIESPSGKKLRVSISFA